MTCVGGRRSLPFRSSTTPAGGRRMCRACVGGYGRVPTPSPWRMAPALGSILRRLGVCLLALVAILGAATDTGAHPHIWIDTVEAASPSLVSPEYPGPATPASSQERHGVGSGCWG
jgi:hypothetical protein